MELTKKNINRNIIRLALPATLDASLTQMGYFFFIKIVTMLGTVSLAAHQIAIRIEALSFMPGLALGVVTATIVGTLCIHLPVAYVLGIVLEWGLVGVWFGAALGWTVRAIAVYILFRKGRWITIKV
jgi:Na+-driven multidrug efflux pump